MRKSLVLAATTGFFLVFALTAAALAQPPDGGPSRGPRGEGPRGGPQGGGYGMPSVEEVIKHLDKDDDGRISKEEAPEQMAEHFDHIDADGDGLVTADELKASRERRAGGQRPGGREGQGPPDPGEILSRFDKDDDGKISKEEAPEQMAEHFDHIDADGDGLVTADELKAAPERRGGGRRPGGERPGGPRRMALA